MNTGKTKVIFYLDTDNDVFAFFPDQKYNKGPYLYTCYSHVGQHGPCLTDYTKRCNMANKESYQGLKIELAGVGYNLEILNELKVVYHRGPTPGEIRFGHGATHYIDLPFSLLYKWDRYGWNLKAWTKRNEDGLRYYK